MLMIKPLHVPLRRLPSFRLHVSLFLGIANVIEFIRNKILPVGTMDGSNYYEVSIMYDLIIINAAY